MQSEAEDLLEGVEVEDVVVEWGVDAVAGEGAKVAGLYYIMMMQQAQV